MGLVSVARASIETQSDCFSAWLVLEVKSNKLQSNQHSVRSRARCREGIFHNLIYTGKLVRESHPPHQ